MSKTKHLPFLGKVVWITGASSGLGEELCVQMSNLGAQLILSSRNINNLLKVKDRLTQEHARHYVLQIDLENISELSAKADMALEQFGKIDILINNAGLAIRDFAINTNLETDQKLMNINYFGPIVLSKALLPHFISRDQGHFIIISSLSGKFGVPRTSAYSASKHALHGFFETLRSELVDKNIFITVLVPGIIKTEITAHALLGDGESFGKIETTFKQAYPADRAVRKMVSDILKQKEESFIGGADRITLWLNRISPWLLRRFIRNHPIKKLRNFRNKFKIK